MKYIGLIALILVVIGGLNWGLVGLFEIDLVAMIFGEMTMATRVIYTLVGIASIAKLAMFVTHSKHCCNDK